MRSCIRKNEQHTACVQWHVRLLASIAVADSLFLPFRVCCSIIYQMCIQKAPHCWTPQLYERYDQSMSGYLSDVVLPAIQRQSGGYLISEVVRRWDDHLVMRKWMYDFFRYLDRFYVKRHGKKALNEVAISRFRTLIFDKCKSKLTQALLEAIRKDRNGEDTDRSMLHKAVSIYVELGLGSLRLYQSEFERAFLESSKEYYAKQAALWIGIDSCPEYLRKAESRFKDEKKRVQDYLVPSTEIQLLRVRHLSRRTDAGCDAGLLSACSRFPLLSVSLLCRPSTTLSSSIISASSSRRRTRVCARCSSRMPTTILLVCTHSTPPFLRRCHSSQTCCSNTSSNLASPYSRRARLVRLRALPLRAWPLLPLPPPLLLLPLQRARTSRS